MAPWNKLLSYVVIEVYRNTFNRNRKNIYALERITLTILIVIVGKNPKIPDLIYWNLVMSFFFILRILSIKYLADLLFFLNFSIHLFLNF